MKFEHDLKSGELFVCKYIPKFKSYASSNYNNLLELYDLIKKKKIPHTYKMFSFEYNKSNNCVIHRSKLLESNNYYLETNQDVKILLLDVRLYLILYYYSGVTQNW